RALGRPGRPVQALAVEVRAVDRVAHHCVEPVSAAVVVGCAVTCLEVVVAVAAVDDVLSPGVDQLVISGAAREKAVRGVAGESVVSGASEDALDIRPNGVALPRLAVV